MGSAPSLASMGREPLNVALAPLAHEFVVSGHLIAAFGVIACAAQTSRTIFQLWCLRHGLLLLSMTPLYHTPPSVLARTGARATLTVCTRSFARSSNEPVSSGIGLPTPSRRRGLRLSSCYLIPTPSFAEGFWFQLFWRNDGRRKARAR